MIFLHIHFICTSYDFIMSLDLSLDMYFDVVLCLHALDIVKQVCIGVIDIFMLIAFLFETSIYYH